MHKLPFNSKLCPSFSYKRDENHDCPNSKCETSEWLCFRNAKGKIEYKRATIVVFYAHSWCVWANGVKRFKMGVFGLRASKGQTSMPSLDFYYHKNHGFILG